MAQDIILPGYESVVANKKWIIIDHFGPASYNNTGTFATSGETFNVSALGLGGIDYLQADMISNDGLNYAWPIPTTGGNGNAVSTVVLHWYVLSTNAEVANTTNLSGKAIRLFIVGV